MYEYALERTLQAKGVAAYDPYLLWAYVSGFKDFTRRNDPDGNSVELIVELKRTETFESFQRYVDRDGVLVDAWGDNPRIQYVTGRFTDIGVRKLARDSKYVKRFMLANPLHAPRSRFRPGVTTGGATMRGDPSPSNSTTLLAVIDDGCPFAHAMLRRGDGTLRLRALWDQDCAPDFSSIGWVPKGFGYGAEVDRAALRDQIDRWATTAQASTGNVAFQSVDEAGCYRELGYEAAYRAYSHGAVSLGMMLRGAPYDFATRANGQVPTNDGAGMEHDVLFVQLPRNVVEVPFHGARLRSILDGIRWVLSRAMCRETEIIVLVPYGSYLGSHDGRGIFTKAIDALVTSAKDKDISLKVILPTGNDAKKKQHWVGPPRKAKEKFQFRLRLASASELPTFLEIWLPKGLTGTFSVKSPTGESVFDRVGEKATRFWPSLQLAQCMVLRSGWGGDSGECALLRFGPTSEMFGACSTEPGDWTITFHPSKVVKKKVHAYVSTARGGIGSLHRANQSHFLIDFPSGSLNDAATGEMTWVIGAYKKWTYRIDPIDSTPHADRSADMSLGPARGGSRNGAGSNLSGPNFSMPDQASPSLAGLRTTGNRSASTVRISGTSVAAGYFAARLGNGAVPAKNIVEDVDGLGKPAAMPF